MKYGYLRTSYKKELKDFTSRVNADKVVVDLQADSGDKSNAQFLSMLDSVNSGDVIVIKSLETAIRGITQKEYSGMDDLCLLINTCKDKDVQLESHNPEDDIKSLLTTNGNSAIHFLRGIVVSKVNSSLTPDGRFGRPHVFPPGFLEVYQAFKADRADRKKKDKMNSKKAAETLGINLKTFYALVTYFERAE